MEREREGGRGTESGEEFKKMCQLVKQFSYAREEKRAKSCEKFMQIELIEIA